MALLMALLPFFTFADTRPNIILILTDDMGLGDLSCYGGKIMETPNIDKMAAEGTLFKRYYSTSPICSPSRAGLLTGKHPAHWNITSYLQSKGGNKNAEMADFLTVKAHTLPRTFKEAGYKTGHFGKWHLGGGRDVDNAPSLLEYGYDEYVSTYESPDPDPMITTQNWIWSKEDKIKRWERTGYFVDKAVAFLKKHKNTPCFINLWPDDVHTPWVGNEQQMDAFPKGAGETENFKTVLKRYDEEIGRLFKLLKENQLDKNTLVIFTSDNGPAPSFKRQRTNGFRGCKASLFEGGIRMPFIVWFKNAPNKGGIDETTVISALDIFKTLCKIANIEPPKGFESDGEDLSSALLGTPQKRSTSIFWEYGRNESKSFPRPKGFDLSPNLALLEWPWKLLVNADGSQTKLFDLDKDPFESKNLAKDFPDMTKLMKEKALKWRTSLPNLSN